MAIAWDSQDTELHTEKSHLLKEKKPTGVQRNTDTGSCLATRHVLAIWGFFGFVNLFALRVDLSVALVAMVNESHNTSNESMGHTEAGHHGEFKWGVETQGIILGAFFGGYCMTQIPGGWLAEVVGGKKLFGLGIMLTSLLTLVTPIAARFSLYALIGLRVLEGMAQGIAFPSMHSIWSKWAPVWERSRLVSITYAGAQIGTILTLLVTGELCDSNIMGGWPSAFYIFGVAGFIWSLGWMALIYDCPAQHPRISKEERQYIEESIGETTPRSSFFSKTHTPWRKIFLSKGLWAIVAAHMAADWGCFTTMTCLPQFMKDVLHFDIKQNGLLSSLPYMVLWFANTISGPIADYIRRRGYLSTKTTRKVMNSIGLLLPVGFMMSIGYAGCNPALVVALLCVAIGLNGFTMAGYSVNHLDIAPRYAGIMMGITNTFGTTTGFIGPAVVGALTDNHQSMEEWRIFFFITAGVYAVGGLIFLVFSEGEPAPWYYEVTVREEENVPSIQTEDAEDPKQVGEKSRLKNNRPMACK